MVQRTSLDKATLTYLLITVSLTLRNILQSLLLVKVERLFEKNGKTIYVMLEQGAKAEIRPQNRGESECGGDQNNSLYTIILGVLSNNLVGFTNKA